MMATHHGRTGQPPEKDPTPRNKTLIFQMNIRKDIDDFENIEHENHAWLRDLTNVVDYLDIKLKQMRPGLQRPYAA